MTDKAKTYRVKGIDLHIDGEHIPEGSEIELAAEPSARLARYLEPIESAKPSKSAKATEENQA